ncbi:MAG: xanthine dehydrogenase family protein subunit M [Thermodesulfobacteriota bacterium]
MLLPKFELHFPTSLAEACGLLRELPGESRLLAGGTDLLVNMKRKLCAPDHVVALDRVPELAGIDRNGGLDLGARVTMAELAASPVLAGPFLALAEGAGKLGSPLIRNRATLGGNLAAARPAADTAPPLLVLGARVVLARKDGAREIPLDQFFRGPGRTIKDRDEVLTRILIPEPEAGSGSGYVKLGLRQTLEISIVNVAAGLTLAADGRTIKAAKVALGSVAPTPILSPGAEAALLGAPADEGAFDRAAAVAASDARPITDHRGSAEYRRLMVEVLTKRALKQALDNALRPGG